MLKRLIAWLLGPKPEPPAPTGMDENDYADLLEQLPPPGSALR